MLRVTIAEKLSLIQDHWHPRIVGELNGQHVKLVKFQGEFVWHHHETEDEFFYVIRGNFCMEYREGGTERSIILNEGEFIIIPRGVEHRPVASHEVEVMLFEPAGTVNTGNILSQRTVHTPDRI